MEGQGCRGAEVQGCRGAEVRERGACPACPEQSRRERRRRGDAERGGRGDLSTYKLVNVPTYEPEWEERGIRRPWKGDATFKKDTGGSRNSVYFSVILWPKRSAGEGT